MKTSSRLPVRGSTCSNGSCVDVGRFGANPRASKTSLAPSADEGERQEERQCRAMTAVGTQNRHEGPPGGQCPQGSRSWPDLIRSRRAGCQWIFFEQWRHGFGERAAGLPGGRGYTRSPRGRGRGRAGRMASANAGLGGLGREEALALLRAVPHGIAVLDAEGRFPSRTTPAPASWPGATGSDLLGRSWREVYDPEEADRLEGEGFAPARGGAPWRGEATVRRHDGVHVPLDMVIDPPGRRAGGAGAPRRLGAAPGRGRAARPRLPRRRSPACPTGGSSRTASRSPSRRPTATGTGWPSSSSTSTASSR